MFRVVGQAIRVGPGSQDGIVVGVDLTVTVENVYSDGHQSEQTLAVRLDSVADDEICGSSSTCKPVTVMVWVTTSAIYTATVLACPQRPEFVGLSREWG